MGLPDRSCSRRGSDDTRYPAGMTISDEQIDRLAAGLAAIQLDKCSDEEVSELRVAALADLLAAAEEHRADERALGALPAIEAALAERGVAWVCDCGQVQREDAAVCSCGGTLGQQVRTEMELGRA